MEVVFVHVPRTAGTSIRKAYRFEGNHRTALARRKDDPEAWDKAFKFTIVRNPWAQVCSFWPLLGRRPEWRGHCDTFRQWIMAGLPTNWSRPEQVAKGAPADPLDQLSMFTDEDGNDLVDFVGRFENLNQALNTVCQRTGTPARPLRHTNGSGDGSRYRAQYDEKTKAVIAARYAKFIARFGYAF